VNSLIEDIELKRVNKNNVFNGNVNSKDNSDNKNNIFSGNIKHNNDPSTYVNSRKYSHTSNRSHLQQ
jgi:hypothetical protein